MKIGDDVWAVCDPETGDIIVQNGTLLLYTGYAQAELMLTVLAMTGTPCVLRSARLMEVRIGKIPKSEIDAESKK